MSKSFEELISKANQKTLKKVSVSNAQDEPVLQAVKAAKEQNIATAILVGDEAKIREIAASIDNLTARTVCTHYSIWRIFHCHTFLWHKFKLPALRFRICHQIRHGQI